MAVFRMVARNQPMPVGPALDLKHRRELAGVVKECERREETFDLGFGQSWAQSCLGTPLERGLGQKFEKDESHIRAMVSEKVDCATIAIGLPLSWNSVCSLTAGMSCRD